MQDPCFGFAAHAFLIKTLFYAVIIQFPYLPYHYIEIDVGYLRARNVILWNFHILTLPLRWKMFQLTRQGMLNCEKCPKWFESFKKLGKRYRSLWQSVYKSVFLELIQITCPEFTVTFLSTFVYEFYQQFSIWNAKKNVVWG